MSENRYYGDEPPRTDTYDQPEVSSPGQEGLWVPPPEVELTTNEPSADSDPGSLFEVTSRTSPGPVVGRSDANGLPHTARPPRQAYEAHRPPAKPEMLPPEERLLRRALYYKDRFIPGTTFFMAKIGREEGLYRLDGKAVTPEVYQKYENPRRYPFTRGGYEYPREINSFEHENINDCTVIGLSPVGSESFPVIAQFVTSPAAGESRRQPSSFRGDLPVEVFKEFMADVTNPELADLMDTIMMLCAVEGQSAIPDTVQKILSRRIDKKGNVVMSIASGLTDPGNLYVTAGSDWFNSGGDDLDDWLNSNRGAGSIDLPFKALERLPRLAVISHEVATGNAADYTMTVIGEGEHRRLDFFKGPAARSGISRVAVDRGDGKGARSMLILRPPNEYKYTTEEKQALVRRAAVDS